MGDKVGENLAALRKGPAAGGGGVILPLLGGVQTPFPQQGEGYLPI